MPLVPVKAFFTVCKNCFLQLKEKKHSSGIIKVHNELPKSKSIKNCSPEYL